MKSIKLTFVGDGAVGKTCMIMTYIEGKFPSGTRYVPTVYEKHEGYTIRVDNVLYKMTLYDTAGQEDYDRLRPLGYTETACFLLCFSVAKPDPVNMRKGFAIASYANVGPRWTTELRHYCPTVPIVLLATQTDLRRDSMCPCYTEKEGRTLKKKIGAQSYMECSAKNNQGVTEAIEEAVRVATRPKVPRISHTKCSFL